jgi:hypothetical protein
MSRLALCLALAAMAVTACTSGSNGGSPAPAPAGTLAPSGATPANGTGTGTGTAAGSGSATIGGGSAAGAAAQAAGGTAATTIIGTWATDCAQNASTSSTSSTSAENQVTFTATNLTLDTNAYLDAGCTQPSTTISLASTYVLSGSSTAVSGAQQLDVTPTTATLTIHDADSVQAANSQKLYGYSNWVAEQPQDITGLDPTGQPAAKSKPFYTIVQVNGAKLYLGQKQNSTDDNTTPAGRDSQLNTVLVYFQQQN